MKKFPTIAVVSCLVKCSRKSDKKESSKIKIKKRKKNCRETFSFLNSNFISKPSISLKGSARETNKKEILEPPFNFQIS